MVNLTTVRFQVEGENGVKYGGFAIDRNSEDPIHVEKIFEDMKAQQPEGIKIEFKILSEKPKDQCDKEGIRQLDSKKKVEEIINESVLSLQKLDNPSP